VIAPHRAPVEVSRSAEPGQLDPGSLFMQSRDLTLRPLYLVLIHPTSGKVHSRTFSSLYLQIT